MPYPPSEGAGATGRRLARFRDEFPPDPLGGAPGPPDLSRLTQLLVAESEELVIAIEDNIRAAAHLLTALGHKIRTPLAGIVAAIDLVADSHAIDSGSAELISIAQESAQRLESVLTRIVEYMESGSPSAGRLRRVDPAHLASSLDIPSDVRIIAPGSASFWVDTDLVSRSLREVFDNARAASARSVTLVVTVTKNGDVTFAVIDDGIGFPPDAAERVFEPLYQTNPYGDAAGAGLGLAIVESDVAAAGGSVGACSSLGGPTRVWFRLPGKNPESGGGT